MRRVFPVVLSAAALAAVPATASAAVEPWADVSVSAPTTFAEPPPGFGSLTLTFTRPDASQPVTFFIRTSDVTARSDSDYQPIAATFTMPAGVTSQQFAISINGDRYHERPAESFRIAFEGPAAEAADLPVLEPQIIDDDPFVAFPALPAGTSDVTDGDYACDGGFYSVTTVSGRRVVNCLGGAGAWSEHLAERTGPLRTTETDADRTATFTLEQHDGIAWSTPAFYDYELVDDADSSVVAAGQVRFNKNQVVAPLDLPIPGDDVETGDRSFTLRVKTFSSSLWQEAIPLTVAEDDVAPTVDPSPAPTGSAADPVAAPAPAAPAPLAPATPRAAVTTPAAPLTITTTPTPLTAALRSGVGLDVAVRQPTRITARLMLSDRDRRALGLRYRTAGLKTVRVSGSAKVRVRLRADVRRALARRGRALKLTARIGGVGAAREIPVRLGAR